MKGKGYRREAGSGRSPDQQPRPDEQEPDRGKDDRTSGQQIAKSKPIKVGPCKSGGRAAKAVELTSGDLPRAVGRRSNTIECAAEASVRESDHAAGVSRGRSSLKGCQSRTGRVPNPCTSGRRPERNWKWRVGREPR